MTESQVAELTKTFEMWLTTAPSSIAPTTRYQYLASLRRLFRIAADTGAPAIEAALKTIPLSAYGRTTTALRQYERFVAGAISVGLQIPDEVRQISNQVSSIVVEPIAKPTKPKPTITPEVAQAILTVARAVDPRIEFQRKHWITMQGNSRASLLQSWAKNRLNWRRSDTIDILAISTWENIHQVTRPARTGPDSEKVMVIFGVAGAASLGGPLAEIEPALDVFAKYSGFTTTDAAPRPLLPKFPRSVAPFTAKELRKLVPEVIRAEEQQRLAAGNG